VFSHGYPLCDQVPPPPGVPNLTFSWPTRLGILYILTALTISTPMDSHWQLPFQFVYMCVLYARGARVKFIMTYATIEFKHDRKTTLECSYFLYTSKLAGPWLGRATSNNYCPLNMCGVVGPFVGDRWLLLALGVLGYIGLSQCATFHLDYLDSVTPYLVLYQPLSSTHADLINMVSTCPDCHFYNQY
jgi:hypothetical protein